MNEFQILLSVEHRSTKSKYPFCIMDEFTIKKTRKYIDVEFVPSIQGMRKISRDKVRGGNVKVGGKNEIIFIDFT
jgi:hypothetical protein